MNVTQLLNCPLYSEDIQYSLSLTGQTELKDRSFKYRISTQTGMVVNPLGKLITIKSDPSWPTKKKKVKKEGTLDDCITDTIVKKEKKVREYSINKSLIRKRIQTFICCQRGKKKLYFFTVTFPFGTSDDVAFILLNKWLTRLRQENLLQDYLWVSERQENGTIHYHIAIPHYLDVKKANKYMRASIMYSISKKEIDWARDSAKKYNGVDIAKNRKTKRITNFAVQNKAKSLQLYLTKYITKNDHKYSHLAWHCSRGFSRLILSYRLTAAEYAALNIAISLNTEKVFVQEYFTFTPYRGSPPACVLDIIYYINFLASQLN